MDTLRNSTIQTSETWSDIHKDRHTFLKFRTRNVVHTMPELSKSFEEGEDFFT